MLIEKKPFRKYSAETTETKQKPISVKLNDKDREMLEIASYALNMHSQGGVLKMLALWGFQKVVLDGLGVEELHYITRSDRTKVVQEKPTYRYFGGKGNADFE